MRRLPFLSKSDRRVLLLLEWILVIVLVIGTFFSWQRERTPNGANGSVADSIRRHGTGAEQSGIIYAEQEEVVETFRFDPNTADSTTLLRLGLAPWQVRSIYRYRAKHGRYHTPEDFKRLPGMTNELWERLSPHISIDKKYQYVENTPPRTSAETTAKETKKSVTATSTTDGHSQKPEKDTLSSSADGTRNAGNAQGSVFWTEKLAHGTLVDINTADTSMLKKIPGIASYRARKIVEYREKMGGFVNTGQVMEACRMPDNVLEWLTVNPGFETRKVNVNTASVPSMMKHPYINFYQAKDIYELRKKNGRIESFDILLSKEVFTAHDVERLRPYIAF